MTNLSQAEINTLNGLVNFKNNMLKLIFEVIIFSFFELLLEKVSIFFICLSFINRIFIYYFKCFFVRHFMYTPAEDSQSECTAS